MSDTDIPLPGSKKRRLQHALKGACDICSVGNTWPKAEGTHTPKVADSRSFVAPTQKLIAAILSPTAPYTLPEESSAVLRTLVDIATYARSLEQELATLKGTAASTVPFMERATPYTRPPTPTDIQLSATEGCVLTELNDRMRGLMVDSTHNRFYGQSSDIMLLKTAMDIKRQTGDDKRLEDYLIAIKRPEYWNSHPWHRPPPEAPEIYTFPEEDLMYDLIELYFFHVHPFLPLLHRPTFEKSVAENLHLTSSRFGATLLLVCALAARYSSDPRVYLAGTNNSEHSCGWKWIGQIRLVKQSFTTTPSLYDVQICCLAVVFLQGTGCPELCWVLTSIGIRLAQDVGAHRRRRYNGKKPEEDQLWTRAFWVLVCIDILLSASFGRPRATTADDFDLDLPVECDDMYWENSDPQLAFKQPPGKPSLMAYMICYIKLLDILGFAQKTLYTLKRSKKRGAEAEHWNQQVVAELDSAMNHWIDSIPDHCAAMGPTQGGLHVYEPISQLFKYRSTGMPFIPAPGRSSPLSYPSLAVCANSARSCSHVMAVQSRRGLLPLAHVQMALFDSSVILLILKQTGMAIDREKELQDVHACLDVLRSFERRWQIAGRLWDTLYAMLSVGDILPSPSSAAPSLKRDRDSTSLSPVSSSDSQYASEPRTFAGSPQSLPKHPEPQAKADQPYILPVYTTELGQFEITNPLAQDTFAGNLPAEYIFGHGLSSWTTEEGVLPSDFFTSDGVPVMAPHQDTGNNA
ncbi:fungal-specific transcription factor domain-containing protein [Mycena rebaudengoi]|nr:fungal-specific transcription factor domain-containing protein [Mycena rebaudengoi]